MELKAPHDYVSIARLMGLPFDKAYAVITKTVEESLSHGGRRSVESSRRREAPGEFFGSTNLLSGDLFVHNILPFF